MLNIFISYSRENKEYMEGIEKAFSSLKRDKKITLWIDKNQILPSSLLHHKISSKIKNSNIVLLLLSVNFWASDYIREKELPLILSEHKKRGLLIYPIILEDLKDYINHKELESITASPFNEEGNLTPIIDFKVKNRAYNQIAEDIDKLSKKLLFNPYKHLSNFEIEDSHNFYGRKELSNELAISVLNTKMTLLTGESGVGKTSLILAGVFPKLNRNKDFKFIYIRCRKNLLELFETLIRKELSEDENVNIQSILKNYTNVENKKILLIFDQFEEVFITVSHEDREFLFYTLLYEIKEEIKDVYMLFSLREDYFIKLNPYREKFKELWNKAIFLHRLEKDNVIKAIINPIGEENISIELANNIYQDLLEIDKTNTKKVFPPLLELVMFELYSKALSRNSFKITQKNYDELGKSNKVLENYFDGVFEQFDTNELRLFREFIPLFITKDNTKNSVSNDEIYKKFSEDSTRREIAKLIEILINRRVIKYTKDIKSYYEFTHDILVELILKNFEENDIIGGLSNNQESKENSNRKISKIQTDDNVFNRSRFTFSNKKYKAFLSYSHDDESFSQWLHRELERYKIPKALYDNYIDLPKSLYPIFRDRYELNAGDDLGVEIPKALENSNALIVVCSIKSANSVWVNKDIIDFKMMHGEDRIFPIILDGEPFAKESDKFEDSLECFPEALKYKIDSDGNLTNERASILAIAKDEGRELAKVKLIAGILGIPLGELYERDEIQKRKKIEIYIWSIIVIMMIGFIIFSFQQKEELRKCIEQKNTIVEKNK